MSWARFAAVLGFLMIPGLTGCHGDAVPNAPPTSAGQVPPQTDSFLGSKAGDEREVGGVKLCWCPPGRFLMGSPANEADHRSDEVQIEVTLTRGFWMGKFEVTQGQWKRFVGEFPDKKPAAEW